MKMTKITTILLFLATSVLYGQADLKKSEIKTNDEEYSFLTERYNKENNFVMLAGYKLQPLGIFENEEFNYDYQLFIESETNYVKAIFIKITKKKKNNDKVRYLCIPLNNEDLFKIFDEKTKNLGSAMMIGLYNTGSSMISSYVNYSYNSNKKEIKTTDKEYQFLTEGYSSDDSIKLLEGYELKQLSEEVFEDKYAYNYKLLVDSKTQNVKAIFIKITKTKTSDDKIKNLCMPINNITLFKIFDKETRNLGVNIGYNFSTSNFTLVSKFIDNIYNMK